MRRVRIGKDITVRYPVLTGGEAVSLAGRRLKLILIDPLGNERAIPFRTYGNTLIFTFPASQQRVPGVYKISLYERLSDGTQTVVDSEDVFMLVKSTSQECGGGGVGGNLEVGVRGLSAYEIWLGRGYEGTEDDFLAWIQQPAQEAADTIGNRYKLEVESFDDDGAATFTQSAEEMATTIQTCLGEETTLYVCSAEVGAPASISVTGTGYALYFIGVDGRRHGIDLAQTTVTEDDVETEEWTITRQRVWTVSDIEAALAVSERLTAAEEGLRTLSAEAVKAEAWEADTSDYPEI